MADGSFAKGRGLSHRDLKPGNIFLANVGGKQVAKIGDYRLSKAFDQEGLSGQTMSGNVVGTPYFRSRQQVVDYKYAQPDVDVWAAAGCLYVMITGYSSRRRVDTRFWRCCKLMLCLFAIALMRFLNRYPQLSIALQLTILKFIIKVQRNLNNPY